MHATTTGRPAAPAAGTPAGYMDMETLKSFIVALGVLSASIGMAMTGVRDTVAAKPSDSTTREISFNADVMPILKRECLPCHAEDNYNPSELSLDSHELLMEGGKHGVPVVPGDPEKSILFQKIGPSPPFGDRMPLDPKRKRGMASTRTLSEEEIRIIRAWIEQGAKGD